MAKIEIDADGSKFHYNDDDHVHILHREGGPAVELADGQKEWYINGDLHREDGPALEFPDGDKRWFINGEELTEEEFRIYTQKNFSPDCLR